MKKTTISITEETKIFMDQLLDIQNIYLMGMTAKTKNCDFGRVENYNDFLLNYALRSLRKELEEILKRDLNINIEDFGM